jgi:ketosteroid isomerase-like protein
MVEGNKDLIRRMFNAQLANDIAAYREILDDNLVWQVMQFGEMGRPRGKEEMIALLGLVHKNLGGGRWEKNIVAMTAEGERVAVEATASMELRNGNLYKQRYHYVYVIRNGRVVQAREYLDTLTAANAFKGLQSVTDGPPVQPPRPDRNAP